jgi:hypothetical protein
VTSVAPRSDGHPLERKLARRTFARRLLGYSYRIGDPRAQAFFELVRPAFRRATTATTFAIYDAGRLRAPVLSHFAGGQVAAPRVSLHVEVN